MKIIWCKIVDGDYIVAVSTREKAIARYQEKYNLTKKEAEKEFTEDWQEVTVD